MELFEFNGSKRIINKCSIITSDIKAEQRIFIKFCVEQGRTPLQTNTMLEKTQSGRNVSRALIYRWHKRFSEDIISSVSTQGAGWPSFISETLTSEVRASL